MFRGKESSNRIELSRLVQDLLNFCVSGSLWLWGGAGGWGVSGGIWGHGGGVTTCMHMHMHAHTCTHSHVYMYRNCKWLPTWRHPCLACLTCMCMHVCMCVCMRVCMGHPHTPIPTPTPIQPSATPQVGDLRNQLKFKNT